MAPHSMDSILRPPQWPQSLSHFVTWCLLWDPRSRPTASEALRHEYFADAVDPLRPRSSRSGLRGKKHMSVDSKAPRDSSDGPTLSSSRSSWFRKSIIREHSPAVPPQPTNADDAASPRPPLVHSKTTSVDAAPAAATAPKHRPFVNKRATWTNGTAPANGAPMPILPSIRPISPFSNTVTALAHNAHAQQPLAPHLSQDTKPSKKIGRQLSVQSNGNHYADLSRQNSERTASGQRGIMSPTSEQKEGFFSHLRKRARRLSGKPQGPVTPSPEDVEAGASSAPRQSNRSSMIVDSNNANNMDTILEKSFENVEKVWGGVDEPAAPLTPAPEVPQPHKQTPEVSANGRAPDRYPSLSKSASTPSFDSPSLTGASSGLGRNRRSLHRSTQPDRKYDIPDEEDELLQEALTNAHSVARRMDRRSHLDLMRPSKKETLNPSPPYQTPGPANVSYNPYPTPSPSARRNGMLFDQAMMAEPVTSLNLGKTRPKENVQHRWPTPPYEENEWGASASASIFAASSGYR